MTIRSRRAGTVTGAVVRNAGRILLGILLLTLVPGVVADEGCTLVTTWGPDTGWSGLPPNGIDTDASENVYITDPNDNRVVRYAYDHSISTTWLLRDADAMQSGIPYGIAVDAPSAVYLTDIENNTIYKLELGFFFPKVWGSSGTGTGQFSHPTGIAVDRSGNIYVADTGNNRIQKIHSTGQFLIAWGSYGVADGAFNAPEGIAVDASGHVYVADTGNNRIQKFSPDGTFLAKWGSGGTGTGQFSRLGGLATDSYSNIYVTDHTPRVQKFNPTGEFLSSCEAGGNAYDVAVDRSGMMYVLLQSATSWKIGMYRAMPATPAETPVGTRTASISALQPETTKPIPVSPSVSTALEVPVNPAITSGCPAQVPDPSSESGISPLPEIPATEYNATAAANSNQDNAVHTPGILGAILENIRKLFGGFFGMQSEFSLS